MLFEVVSYSLTFQRQVTPTPVLDDLVEQLRKHLKKATTAIEISLPLIQLAISDILFKYFVDVWEEKRLIESPKFPILFACVRSRDIHACLCNTHAHREGRKRYYECKFLAQLNLRSFYSSDP